MVRAAPRIPDRLVDAIARVDDGKMPIAEVCRRIGALAEQHGVTRPSYEGIRVLVHLAREERRPLGPSDLQLIFEGGSGYRGYSETLRLIRMPRAERPPDK